MSANDCWSRSFSHSIDSSTQALWQVLSDAPNWHRWNPGVKAIEMEGDFTNGTWFTMVFPEGGSIRSRLIDVRPLQGFTDETCVGEVVIQVAHRLQDISARRCLVTYTLSARGPDTQAMGEAISADFPEVLAGLQRYLQPRTN